MGNLMFSFLTKSLIGTIVGTTAAKVVHDTYPPIKKVVLKSVDSIQCFFSSNSLSIETKAIPKGRVRKPRNQLTKQQYSIILASWDINANASKSNRLTQVELSKQLNEKLGINYSRSGYCHLVFKRVIPKFENNNDK